MFRTVQISRFVIGISQPQPIFSEKNGFWQIGNIYTCLVLTVKGPHGFKCTYMGAHGFKMCLHSETFSFIEREMSQLPKYWVVSTMIGLTWDLYNICNSFKSKGYV